MKVHHVERGDTVILQCGVVVEQRSYPERVLVDLFYHDGEVDTVEVRSNVREVDAIRISYDIERDGHLIEQSDHAELENWVEVAFVPAWGKELPRSTDDD